MVIAVVGPPVWQDLAKFRKIWEIFVEISTVFLVLNHFVKFPLL